MSKLPRATCPGSGIPRVPSASAVTPATRLRPPSAVKTLSANPRPPIGQSSAVARPDTGRPSMGRQSIGRPSIGKPVQGRPSLGKLPQGRPSLGKLPQGRPSLGKLPQGRPSIGRPSTGKLQVVAASCDNPTCKEKAKAQPQPQAQKAGKTPKDDKKVAKEIVNKEEMAKKPRREFELPPLSVSIRKKDVFEEFEKLKAKTRRRNAPEGEDLKAIKMILKSMIEREITVHEFVGELAQYTADNGTALRTILANELSHFRTMARGVYETMTQDISDVLVNEHVQLTRASKERHGQYTDKMMRAVDDIFEQAPNFSFDKYYNEKNFLDTVFPLPPDHKEDEETEAMRLRQETYHRLMWLRSEGDRLSEENKRLMLRLKELKQRQKAQLKTAGEIEKINEDKRKELEKTQEVLEDQLEEMNTSIEKSIVEQEKAIREEEDRNALKPPIVERPIAKQVLKRDSKPPENWGIKTAVELEESHATENLVSEVSRASVASGNVPPRESRPSLGAIPKKAAKPAKGKAKKKFKFTKPKVEQDRDPFHYSPIKTPPQAQPQARERSPFHFSPPKTPPGGYLSQAAGGRSMETTRVTATTSDVEHQRPAPQRLGRRTAGPRDTWGGFY